MTPVDTETIILIVAFFAVCIGAIVWGTVRKKHGKSDRLTSSIVDDIREGKPYRTLVKAEIMTNGIGYTTSKGSMASSVGRAAVGGALFGGAGAIGGAASGKRTMKHRGETTFKLYYEDGHTEIETVMDQTPIWEKYMKLVPEQKN